MKLKAAAVFLIVLNFSCTQKPANTAVESTASSTPSCGSIYTSTDVADTNINRYNRVWKAVSHTETKPPITAYTIRSLDLLAALGVSTNTAGGIVCTYDHVRVYLALDRDTAFKLYVVPVTGADLCNGKGGRDTTLIDPTHAVSGTCVLDLNTPCPNVCAVNGLFSSAGH